MNKSEYFLANKSEYFLAVTVMSVMNRCSIQLEQACEYAGPLYSVRTTDLTDAMSIRRALIQLHGSYVFEQMLTGNRLVKNTFAEKCPLGDLLCRLAFVPIRVHAESPQGGWVRFSRRVDTDPEWLTTDDLILDEGILIASPSEMHTTFRLARVADIGALEMFVRLVPWTSATTETAKYRAVSSINCVQEANCWQVSFRLTGRLTIEQVAEQLDEALRSESIGPTKTQAFMNDTVSTPMPRKMACVHNVRPEVDWYSTMSHAFDATELALFEVGSQTGEKLLDEALFMKMISTQQQLDSMSSYEKRQGRAASNPWECLGKHIFINRAALKMAEMDKLFGLLPAAAKLAVQNGSDRIRIGDFGSGPGGFSEYCLWRAAPSTVSKTYKRDRTELHELLQESLHGVSIVGVTLANEKDDFRVADFVIAPTEREEFTSVYGPEGTGDLTCPQVCHDVRSHVGEDMLQLVLCDGGFDTSGREAEQEMLSVALICSEAALGLETLSTGGSLLCKIFLTSSPVMCRLLAVLATAFDRICIVKPTSSRPANSERYVVCEGYRESGSSSAGLLRQAAEAVTNGRPMLLPANMSEDFVRWLRKITNRHMVHQTKALVRYVQGRKDANIDPQAMKEDAFKFWCLNLHLQTGRKRKNM